MSESTNARLSDIVGIRLKGGTFSVPTDLNFFPSPQKKQTNGNKSPKLQKDIIIYGRNGAGKSTIARAIKSIAGKQQPAIQDAQFFDKNNQPISLDENESKRIFVFDEEFIDKNIKFQENGLDTIIMLGEHIDLEKQLSLQKDILANLQPQYEKQKREIRKYNDPEHVESPLYWLKQIQARLQGDSNWAGRTKEIENLQQNPDVNDTTYEQFLNIHPSAGRDELYFRFATEMNQLNVLRQYPDVQPITESVPLCHLENYSEKRIQELLAQKIEPPTLSDREKKLLELGFQELDKRKKVLANPGLTKCPYCFQPLSKNYRLTLFLRVLSALRKINTQHGKDLQQQQHKAIQIPLDRYKPLHRFERCKNLLEKLNQAIQINNEKLIRKHNNPYTPIKEDVQPVTELCHKLNDALIELELERIMFNNKNSTIKKLEKELTHLNNEITYYDIAKAINQHAVQQRISNVNNQNFKHLENALNECEEKISILTEQLNNVTVALDLINGYLQYIFFDKNRLRIDFQKDVYVLRSNGHSVRPSDISTGERNILALCYFFARIMQGQNPAEAGTKDYLLVIDDPVSSFDMGNRVGIMSFLNFQVKQFLTGNSQTHFIILTHNLQVYYDLKATFQAIYNLLKGDSQRKFQGVELSKHQFIEIKNESRQEYSALMSIIYDYAAGKSDVISAYDLSIGNMMRQVLEAFTTFLYKKGINEITTDKDISEILKQKHVQPYFGRLMYGMMLHGESHTEIKVQTMQNMEFLPSYSQEEKQKIAKSILCLIYLLIPKHLHSHLAMKPDLEPTMKKWCKEIREENPSMT